MKRIKNIIITGFVLLLISCNDKYSFLNEYPHKILPYIDSTNFSNHVEGKLLSEKEKEKLDLKTIFGEELNTSKTKIGISYLLNLSEEFTTIIYYSYKDNSELMSVLVNYDKEFNIINSQMLAYDEISDGVLKAVSMIYKDKIVLKEYVSESASIIKFDVLTDGNIIRE